jgi:hypothetical protein
MAENADVALPYVIFVVHDLALLNAWKRFSSGYCTTVYTVFVKDGETHARKHAYP